MEFYRKFVIKSVISKNYKCILKIMPNNGIFNLLEKKEINIYLLLLVISNYGC